ncbi:bck1-like resistance to osmotic shock [Bacidia gigantensis]|uniref:bck1-like resistance to osmotic shock n=1 Tax=Bacidia gigantensis TaxID=2732470 RepID=UPI001D03A336|nr:bck1-like resistance to osmotic shock [Bacidia gigantensis]KAG8531644.1 bck1-like resistance to osmotic shock [Bacidia gigantensis]
MPQSPMISTPLKQTNEIDWVFPLKSYIRQTYGDDPERYAEECNTLNRLRQDMRGAGRDSTAGRDLLYRYYGQLELLDLRFPVDENHIKISFTWFDAFTHQPTSQYSLAFEKASIIFNISAALSCHAAFQDRNDDSGQKSAYHSFQASAGMFTYINENFLHAPSKDLSRETVKTLIMLMLAQAQEVFVEKQIADGRKVGLLAKLASQAALLHAQALEGVQENVSKNVFDRLWLLLTQIKASHMSSVAQYYQALADDDANAHGVAIARLELAERESKDAVRGANSFPTAVTSTSNLSSETRASLLELTTRHTSNVQERLATCNKDNDFIYHQTVPAEVSLAVIPKLAAAKAIPVGELYQGQDIQRIIGPDIFQKIVPMAVTEAASLYDEEKAKLVRAEAENVETADGEMAASLDYLKLPGSLIVLKGGMEQEISVDEDFHSWCQELAGHEPFGKAFEALQADKGEVLSALGGCSKSLDQEESTCEKMRSKYGAEWTQQPSLRLNATLKSDIKVYKRAIDEASSSDALLIHSSRQNESDFDEMRSAGETHEADVLYQRAMMKSGSGKGKGRDGFGSPAGTSVMDQVGKVEDLLRKLELVKRDRAQVLKDLKEKVHNDDISHVLILNKKSISNHEQQLFQAELDKFRPHQNRLLQANHKQTALMKELTKTYSILLQDKRVKSEQAKYDNFTRQRTLVLMKYKKVFQAFNDLMDGLGRAQGFYLEMKETVDNLEQNVESFVNNRRAEGAQLLNQIEQDRQNTVDSQTDRERDRLRDLMERMSTGTTPSSNQPNSARPSASSRSSQPNEVYGNRPPAVSPSFQSPLSPNYNSSTFNRSPITESQAQRNHRSTPTSQASYPYTMATSQEAHYNPLQHLYQPPMSHPNQQQYGQSPQYVPQQNTKVPQGYVPPPPPPGPPPHSSGYPYHPSNHRPPPQGSSQHQQPNDPWAGLNSWK